MYNVIQKHKSRAVLWSIVGSFALIFCLMCGKDMIETEYFLNKAYPPEAIDYVLYFGTRIFLLVCIAFIVLELKKSKQTQKFLKENTVKVAKIIYKGKVIAKDSKSTTNGNSTSHSYITSIRLVDISAPAYFYDKDTYMSCLEGEDVAVLISHNLDKDGKILATKFDFMGNYEKYQRIKDEYMERNPNINPLGKNIPWNEYTIK